MSHNPLEPPAQTPAELMVACRARSHCWSSTQRPPACGNTRSRSRPAPARTASSKPFGLDFHRRRLPRRSRSDTAVTALLHDFDYERHPSPAKNIRLSAFSILAEQGWPEEIRTAILGHAGLLRSAARATHLAKALFACDELSGLLTACALVKPSRRIAEVDVAGVRRKMKDKGLRTGSQPRRRRPGRGRAGRRARRHTSPFASRPCSATLRRSGL